jgi:outer membrane protein insertion porin family
MKSNVTLRLACTVFLLLSVFLCMDCGPKRPARRSDDEGDLLIGKISFIGAETIKEGQLKKAMRIIEEGDAYSEYKIKVALENVLSYYKTKGFFQAEVLSQKGQYYPEKNRIDLEFTINEGEREIIRSITFHGNERIPVEQLQKTIIVRKGEPYDYLKIFTSKYNIQSLYAAQGYIYADVATSPEDSFLLSKNLAFNIEEGTQVFVDDVLISGNKTVRKRIIEREILIKPGDIYSPQKVHASQQKIYATGLFYDVKYEIEGLKEQKEHVTIIFEVLEGKTKWIALGGAFQTPNRITTDIGWGHDNIFNNNQSISINYTYTFNFEDEKWGNMEINYAEPYFFSAPIHFGLHLFNEREVSYRESGEHRSQYFSNIYGINSRFGYAINVYTELTAELKFKKAFINVIGDYKPQSHVVTNSMLLAYLQDTRDNIFNPRKGVLSLTSIEFAGSILKGDNHFVRYVQDISIYRRFTRRSVIASKIKIGYTVPIENTTGSSISVDERFELGGPSSLRGYAESSIGAPDIRGKHSGIYLINGGEELRFPVYKLLGGALFIDWGGLWLRKGAIKIRDMKLGVGFGLRYNTVIGPIRLDYGYRLTDRTPQYKGNVYFAIGNAY